MRLPAGSLAMQCTAELWHRSVETSLREFVVLLFSVLFAVLELEEAVELKVQTLIEPSSAPDHRNVDATEHRERTVEACAPL